MTHFVCFNETIQKFCANCNGLFFGPRSRKYCEQCKPIMAELQRERDIEASRRKRAERRQA